jgi:hypothetical protein
MEMPDPYTVESRARQLRQEELTRLFILGLAKCHRFFVTACDAYANALRAIGRAAHKI